ncbi:hypothetical protein AZ022_001640 [Klebsiella pneumoniae]|nr:hypothetical protein AZ022_001640 [Klebsiella pneumoniae]
MCIRERASTSLRRWPKPGGTGGGGDWPPPVRSPFSYTHLDVYKRQARGYRGRRRLAAPCTPPVSYTHLDVYKRPGVQGAAATGRPLCAPCAIRDITQKINRERNLPGINIEFVALPNVVALPNIVRTGTFPVVPLFRRVAATPCPAYGVYRRSSLPRPGKRCAAGQSIGAYPPFRRVAAAPYPAYNDCRAIRLGRRLNPARRRCRQTPAAPDASWHWPPAARSTAQSA